MPFRDENDLKGAAKHDRRGLLSMANKGPNTNGYVYHASPNVLRCRLFSIFRSQWFITFKPASHLDKKHTVFGNLVGGEDVLDTLEKVPVKPGTERPAQPIRITDIIMFVLFFVICYALTHCY
jgi:peptidyl-prolyl cis-trans isomerase-like protein 2